ncbi:MAG: hypothetical protein PHO27_12115 [Sulfuricurvum sp.]|nr:hypothetical protein [Sulfuricurvum sp.]
MCIVTEATNFMRVFRLPLQYPEGFCFNGGYPVEIQLVDWFNPFNPEDFWGEKTKELTPTGMEAHRNLLRDFIKAKGYVKQFTGYTFLAIADYGDAFLITT